MSKMVEQLAARGIGLRSRTRETPGHAGRCGTEWASVDEPTGASGAWDRGAPDALRLCTR